MTLDEAIKHLEETLSDKSHKWSCESCKQEHEQLLEWLRELKILRDAHGKVYRNEKCDRAGKCYDYIGYHCAGCNSAKEGGAEE